MFNGNIAETSWSTLSVNNTSNPVSTNYRYQYDALNRITAATSDAGGNYNLSGITYDKNGNILTLQRRGHTQLDGNGNVTGFGLMDNLKYDYNDTNVGNKLVKVQELTGGSPTYGFKDSTNTNNDFEYDQNGNMIVDRNKGITGITYNHLNLPVNVTLAGGTINYTYDAAGNKLRKVANSTTTDYAGGFKYVNGTLQFFNHAEGYVSPKNTNDISQGFNYVYQYKDHLGNVRLSYSDNNNDGVITASSDPNTNEIIEESNYYPFGLKQKGYNGAYNPIGNSLAQKWGYNGKEYQDDLVGGKNLNWHDFGARNYDATIGRWMNLDPLAEQMRRHSPYNYAFNNPIYFIDPDGMAPKSGIGDWIKKKVNQVKSAVVKEVKRRVVKAVSAYIISKVDDAKDAIGKVKAKIKNAAESIKLKDGGGIAFSDGGHGTGGLVKGRKGKTDTWIDAGGAISAVTTVAGRGKKGSPGNGSGKGTFGENVNTISDVMNNITQTVKKGGDAVKNIAQNTGEQEKTNTVSVINNETGVMKTSIEPVTETQSQLDSARVAKPNVTVRINRPDDEK
ncbi:hypothetical protein TSEDIMI_220035 [Tenacibaculum sediminilitoris]|uniref:RHS repeat domain-containing protein n=1 Tax=Tenacibaculum sediminilitoris TaxID=1820334 RepID=UPI003895BEDF